MLEKKEQLASQMSQNDGKWEAMKASYEVSTVQTLNSCSNRPDVISGLSKYLGPGAQMICPG